jgi:hypothetical protein
VVGSLGKRRQRPFPNQSTETDAEPTATRPSQPGVTILADGSVVAVQPVLAVSFTASGRLLELAVAAR